jgi:hypothetical protein
MAGPLLGIAAAVAAGALALAGQVAGAPASSGPVTPFGGSVPVHVAHAGAIDVDLGPQGAGSLRPVPCAGAARPGTTCFVSR